MSNRKKKTAWIKSKQTTKGMAIMNLLSLLRSIVVKLLAYILLQVIKASLPPEIRELIFGKDESS